MKKVQLINVSWFITSRCNYHCEFCFGFKKRPELDLDQAKKIINKLVAAGLKKISFAGGEPLLWPHITDLIAYTKSLGVTTMLITNGELLTEKLFQEFERSLDWMNLSLEGSDPQIHDLSTRKQGHFQRTIQHLERLQNTSIKIKINTVATKINIDDLINIAPIIKKYHVRRWKIFQFYAVRELAIKNKDKFILFNDKYEAERARIIPLFDKRKTCVVFENNQELEDSYFSITPDGYAYLSHQGKDIFFGDLKTEDIQKILQHPCFNKDKYWERSKWVLQD